MWVKTHTTERGNMFTAVDNPACPTRSAVELEEQVSGDWIVLVPQSTLFGLTGRNGWDRQDCLSDLGRPGSTRVRGRAICGAADLATPPHNRWACGPERPGPTLACAIE